MSVLDTPVTLAREPPFAIGSARVRPATREFVHHDGRRRVLEPRVMQVLVALHRAQGEVLGRDDLVRTCWNGLAVSEDAINRVMSRLRRVADDCGDDSFRIETVTKVGYRLVLPTGPQTEPVAAEDAQAPPAGPRTPDRRTLLAGAAGAGGLAMAGGAAWLYARSRGPSARVRALYDQAWTAMNNMQPDQTDQAVGLLRTVVTEAPDYADGWGSLACAYAFQAWTRGPEDRGPLERADAAIRRARELDPDNALAAAAAANAHGVYRRWSASEMAVRKAVERHPQCGQLIEALKWLMNSVGRSVEAARLGDRSMVLVPVSPYLHQRVLELAAAGRMEEADRLSGRLITMFPRNVAVWFTHFYHLMRNGNPGAALAMASDPAGYPDGVDPWEFESVKAEARAVMTRRPADIDAALEPLTAAAHRGRGYAENAMLLASLVGRLDRAFELADAYYFGRGFSPPWNSFGGRHHYLEPRTHLLFWPAAAPMRADPRFDRLVGEIGLKTYWARAGHRPDYLQRKG